MYYYYCTMWYGAEVILLFFQESWLEALKTRVALQGLNHLRFAFIIILWKLPDFYFFFYSNEGNKEVSLEYSCNSIEFIRIFIQ